MKPILIPFTHTHTYNPPPRCVDIFKPHDGHKTFDFIIVIG